jgi:hypothetical protein
LDSGLARSRADGTYTITGLQAGDYTVRFSDCSGRTDFLPEWYDDQPSAESAFPVGVATGGTTAGIDAELTQGGAIAGHITGSGFVCIQAFDTTGTGRGQTVTFNGAYTLHSLPAGTSRLVFTGGCGFTGSGAGQWYDGRLGIVDADPVDVVAGATTQGIDYEYVEGVITGSITSPGGALLSDVCVSVRQTTGTATRTTRTHAFAPENYRIGGLPAGDYRIEFRDCGDRNLATEWYDNRPNFASAVIVPIPAADATAERVDAVLEPPASCPPNRPAPCRPVPGQPVGSRR